MPLRGGTARGSFRASRDFQLRADTRKSPVALRSSPRILRGQRPLPAPQPRYLPAAPRGGQVPAPSPPRKLRAWERAQSCAERKDARGAACPPPPGFGLCFLGGREEGRLLGPGEAAGPDAAGRAAARGAAGDARRAERGGAAEPGQLCLPRRIPAVRASLISVSFLFLLLFKREGVANCDLSQRLFPLWFFLLFFFFFPPPSAHFPLPLRQPAPSFPL